MQKRIGDNPVKTRGRLLGQLATTDLPESFFLSSFFYLRVTRQRFFSPQQRIFKVMTQVVYGVSVVNFFGTNFWEGK